MMTNIVVPELGESVVEARVARWLKQEGDRVEVGEPVVELETEKIDLEVNADKGGVIKTIKHKEGDDVKIGEVLAVVDETASAPDAAAKQPSGNGSKATPTARNVAKEHDVSIASVQGSGAAGRVMKQDVEKAIPAPPASPAPPAPRERSERAEERQRMSKRRATIARRLVEAQHNAAMLTTFNEIDMSAMMALRERRKEAFKEQHGVGLGIASFFVKASVAALKAFPPLNAEIQGDDIVIKRYYDIGMAVGAEGGLVVPVLRDADGMSFAELEHAIRDFAKRAADGTLTLPDLAGGTFTITNGGVFGSLMSTPILNPPQVGILGLHKIQDRAVALDGQVSVRPMMYVALSYDHRIVDGREAVQFLVKIKEFIEDPGHLLLES
ncbi:MAG: dihydrolipoyllysine-residue succinyltransferase [Acidobacteria bacterium]|nr:MAG: dihydrolipoyllysine-residue succinyltransferase [Acidobacteriota bacterium]